MMKMKTNKPIGDIFMENAISDKEQLKKILSNPSPIQYLKVIKDLTFKDFGSRRTCISAGDIGFVLDEEQIFRLPKISAKEKSEMIDEMMSCYDRNALYSLVCGYPCILMPGEYQILDYVPNRCCGELI